jgi:hypothetical protein
MQVQRKDVRAVLSLSEAESLMKQTVLDNLHIHKNHHKERPTVSVHGKLVNATSDRYRTFFTKGMKCVKCGIEGMYWKLERHVNTTVYHLGLYAVRVKDGKTQEVLMTKDHIVPVSKGGKDNLENYQCMCIYCNMQKSDNLE